MANVGSTPIKEHEEQAGTREDDVELLPPRAVGSTTGSTGENLDLTPYVQVFRSLLPRATSIVLFDARGEIKWSNEAVGPDLLELTEDLVHAAQTAPGGPGELRMLSPEQPLYVWWLWGGSGELIAMIAMVCRPSRAGHQALTFIYPLLRPILECLRRELMARTELESLRRTLFTRDQDLRLILAGPKSDAPADARVADEIQATLDSANEHLRCTLSTLIVPEKGLVIVRPGRGKSVDNRLLARTHRQLLSMAHVQREPVIINRLSAGSDPTLASHRILLAPVPHPSGRNIGVFVMFREAADPDFVDYDSRLAEGLARKIASLIETSYDEMSGLLTRPAFERRARAALSGARTAAGWSALYVDIDGLHGINEAYGMHVGDRLIAMLGDLVRRSLPPGALATRVSGDRFTILMPSSDEAAVRIGEALCEAARQLKVTEGTDRIPVSLSIGVTAVDAEEKKLAHGLAQAEAACKAAKDRGRDRVELYSDEDSSIVRRFQDIGVAANLQEAIAEGRLRLYGQTIRPLGGTGRRTYVELLLRMIDRSGQTIGPDRFLAAANRYQVMPTIDRWVIERAIASLAGARAAQGAPEVALTINVSLQSLDDDGFIDFVVERIESSGVDPSRLCFELTENAAVTGVERAQLFMQRVRKLGCGVALDDFGAGLTSLAFLRQLPVTMIKIDGSFVRDVVRDDRSQLLVRAIADLARTMQITTVAECVETEEIRARLVELGVDYGQGFAIGRPTDLSVTPGS